MLKQLVKAGVKPLAAAADLLTPARTGITILIYHRVGAGSGGQVDLDTSVFRDQMAMLAESGAVITLDDAVRLLESGETPDRNHVVITFDDGTPDVVDHAVPILAEYELPMTLYLATGFVGADAGFWDKADPVLSWDAVREAVASGVVDIGSHTHTHALLDRSPADRIDDELDRSIDLIGHEMGLEPRHFAYPKALMPSPIADAAVRRRFESAAIAGTRANRYGHTDVHLLNRSPIQRSDGLRWFERKAAGGMGLEDRLRDVVNSRRYAGATS